ncbi:sialate:O-sulfotransferase 1-like [Daphnia carinata]|uniref:sialate:O-sulfotransferase 1-like n=1 Tax=Daphnia carinata TaxID=120202 RepID=UPI00286887C5|nr:sialate:O-sulfotransferase 1-like [Daphnia carinata]
MKLRLFKDFYVIGLVVTGLVLFSFYRFNYEMLITTNTCNYSSSVANGRQKCDLPTDYITDPDPVSYPWIGDPTCQHFPVQFAKNKTRPKWALTSFPGSGVTWTRQLIEGVTGIYTGTVYGRAESPIVLTGHHGNTADLDCECTILIKDHDVLLPDFASFPTLTNNLVKANETKKNRGPIRSFLYGNRGILLLRNPMDALFTFAHFLGSSGNHTGVVPEKDFLGPQWDKYIDYVADTWADHAVGWIENIQNGTVIFYERLLLEDTAAELKRLLNVINFVDPHHPPVDPERMRCTLLHKDRKDHKRTKKPVIPLTAGHRLKLKSSIERVQESLRKKGWPLLPVYLYNLRHVESPGI